ncbi:iron-containing alcohol dehydrogenase [Zwartia vadi]|uniref:iron-containing alcohol dehydrogenase n=1 Tax=Zwartia vadi TaxID=3058168 RepID=UPI0025B301BD|nr:iron-containing alcohol dehydrogenase [Zwartia vadi]MDN3988556.1 iron-containing alcohol dehydrogenase [Zwartia vadi]
MNEFKPEITFSIGARHNLTTLTGNRPVVILLHAHASRTLIDELRNMFGSRLKEILYCPDGLLAIEHVDRLRQHFWTRHAGRDLPTLIAIGGGSTLDLAKSMRIALPSNMSIASVLDRVSDIGDFVTSPLLLMPTTAGTGSEVSSTATIWDLQRGSKHSFFGSAATADWAVIDPELCLTTPWTVTRDSGVDALAHALESIWNRQRVPKAFAFAMSAAQQITRVLPSLIDHPHDISLRAEMSQAALWAGQAMALTETALVHALSYQDTLQLGISHGQACAKWLPRVYKIARESSEELSIYLRASMEPIISDEWELQEWLIGLGLQPVLLNDKNPEIDARIKAALNSTRGKNFVAAEPVHALQ